MTDIKEVLEERGKNYGEFDDHANITQRLKEALRSGGGWQHCDDSQREALEMVAHKLGRIVNGNPSYLDSWVDIIGYTQLVVDELERNRKDNDEILGCKAESIAVDEIAYVHVCNTCLRTFTTVRTCQCGEEDYGC